MNGLRSIRQGAFMVVVLSVMTGPVAGAATEYLLKFTNKASGGVLVLGRIGFNGTGYVSVETSPGECPGSVAQRLADQIGANHNAADVSDMHRLRVGGIPEAFGDSLKLPEGAISYYLAGTESGLGIPEPPLSLTCVYDEEADGVKLAWENPAGGYDNVFITLSWGLGRNFRQLTVPGDATSFIVDRTSIPVGVRDLYVGVVGIRSGVVSAPGAMHMSGHYQDEAFAIPFARGIMPNWSVWRASPVKRTMTPGQTATGGIVGKKLFRCDKRFTNTSYYAQDGLYAKPFSQVIEAGFSGVVGLKREFIGLTPGHTYRITGALSTLQMHESDSDWSLDICAAHNGPSGRKLAPEQLAGRAALPNGKMGRRAGRIGVLERGGKMTGPGFRLMKSRTESDEGDEEGIDVTLPPGVDTLTVWVRFECLDPTGAVGFMGAGIKDITASQP